MTKEERKKYNKQYYQANKKKVLEHQSEYRKTNKEKIAARMAEYYQANKGRKAEYNAEYRKTNKDKIAEYYATPMGRATYLLRDYKRNDKKYNRGQGDLTAKWIVENIFTKPCAHCGITGWEVIGCNRLDNSLPHTKNNVEPCCFICNCRLH